MIRQIKMFLVFLNKKEENKKEKDISRCTKHG